MAVNQQQEQTLAPKPATVSSASSLETTGSARNDVGLVTALLSQEQSFPTSGVSSIQASSQQTSSSSRANTMMSLVPRPSQMHLSGSTGSIAPTSANASTNTVPEFLYQLTKMLTDNNRDVIEWSNGKIEVHNPQKLQAHVLNKYFRHSKFSSFQRQLNYFGFRKLAGKGKMSPCSYVNDAAGNEIGSLLLIKRKTGNEVKEKRGLKRGRYHDLPSQPEGSVVSQQSNVNPVLAGILYRSTSDSNDDHSSVSSRVQQAGAGRDQSLPNAHQALARVAVGKGITHRFSQQHLKSSIAPSQNIASPELNDKTPVQMGLCALTDNFKNSFAGSGHQASSTHSHGQPQQPLKGEPETSTPSYIPGSLRRDDSLIDLAMIPIVDNNVSDNGATSAANGMTFVDFPWQEPSFLPGEERKM